MKHLTIITILVLVLSSAELRAQKDSFPGTKSSTDPSKRYSVVWIEATSGTEHRLILINLITGQTRLLLKFERHLDLFWAPNGNSFAVTDWGGSDFSNAWIGFPKDSSRTISLKVSSPEVEKNHHVYFEVVRWRSPTSILFKVHGYGDHDPGGFEKYYDSNLKGKIKEIKHRQKK